MSVVNTYFDRFDRRKSTGVVQNGVLLLFISAMPVVRCRSTAGVLAAAAEPPTLPRRLTGRDLHRFPYSKLTAQSRAMTIDKYVKNIVRFVQSRLTTLIIIIIIITRNTFCGTWYLPHSRVHKSMIELCA